MKLCWMFALLFALTVGVRGNPKGMGQLSNVADVISELSELNYMDSDLPDFMIINMNGEPLPFTIVGHGSDLQSRHQARSLIKRLPKIGKKVIIAVRKKLPRSKCTREGWDFTCCVTIPGSKPAEGCFRLEIDRYRLELTGGLIVNKRKLGAWTWEAGKLCAGIPLTLFTGCIHVYYLKWDFKKKELNICVIVTWMSLVNIDYGCLHFDKMNGFSRIDLEPGDEAGLVNIRWENGKPHVDFWKPKDFKEAVSGLIAMTTDYSIKLGDWHKPYIYKS